MMNSKSPRTTYLLYQIISSHILYTSKHQNMLQTQIAKMDRHRYDFSLRLEENFTSPEKLENMLL